MKIFRWFWKNSAFGMDDQDFSRLKGSRGPDLDRLIEKYNVDVWIIGIPALIYLGIRIYDWVSSSQ